MSDGSTSIKDALRRYEIKENKRRAVEFQRAMVEQEKRRIRDEKLQAQAKLAAAAVEDDEQEMEGAIPEDKEGALTQVAGEQNPEQDENVERHERLVDEVEALGEMPEYKPPSDQGSQGESVEGKSIKSKDEVAEEDKENIPAQEGDEAQVEDAGDDEQKEIIPAEPVGEKGPPPANYKTDTWIKLWGMFPPITKMDTSLNMISHCEKLSLSTNQIEKIQNLSTFKNLRILSLSRNSLKNLSGVEAVSDTLVELWVSFNWIEKLRAVQSLKKLQVFYISYNLIKTIEEVSRLGDLPELRDLTLLGNIVQVRAEDEQLYRNQVASAIKSLRRLDCVAVIRD